MLAIVDSGGANITSVRFALERLGVQSELTADPAVIRAAERVILPGVGSAPEGMKRLQAKGLVDCVRGLTQPVLGICLGMQLLFENSEEGDGAGLALFGGTVKKLHTKRVPHMGWNDVEPVTADPLFEEGGFSAYFANSFVADPADPHAVIAWTMYDHVQFPAAVRRDNIWGVQFHPEKSGAAGVRLITRFLMEAARR